MAKQVVFWSKHIYLFMYIIPIIKTNIAMNMGSPLLPERVAMRWAPTARKPPVNVANILFIPFPSVAPEIEKKKKGQIICKISKQYH